MRAMTSDRFALLNVSATAEAYLTRGAESIGCAGMPKTPKPGEGRPFPIIEAFGYAADADTRESRRARERRFCRFMGAPCEKYIQYRFGYCSVTYAAADYEGSRRTYAVCDHRLDGEPVRALLADHLGRAAVPVRSLPEVVLTDPRTACDFVSV